VFEIFKPEEQLEKLEAFEQPQLLERDAVPDAGPDGSVEVLREYSPAFCCDFRVGSGAEDNEQERAKMMENEVD
jgi:hypothetical protein